MGPRPPLWNDRVQAGQQLATALHGWRWDPETLVLGLPRGGIVVAAEVAKQLQRPLHSWAVRKLAHPANPELALGAIAPGGLVIWEEPFARLDPKLREALMAEQDCELRRRQQRYGDPPIERLRDKPVIVVDDGVATGLSVRAAIQSLRAANVSKLVLAVPIIEQHVAQQLRPLVDGLVALATVDDFGAVGVWYRHFDPVQDHDVITILATANAMNDA